MKSKLKIQILFSFLTLLSISATTYLMAQEQSVSVTSFKIGMEIKNQEIKMICEQGCAWKELSYTNDLKERVIDATGVKTIDKISHGNDDITRFSFQIKQTNSGFELKSLNGTAWKSLGFTLSKNQMATIDKYGVSTGKRKN